MSILLRIILLPVSFLYSLILRLRNLAFDAGILPSKSFSFPLIGIGNLTMGGSGKTPHAEFIIDHLSQKHFVALLSRGYGRNTKGFKIADSGDTAQTIGDEPFQMFQKFPKLLVALDEKRKRGIENLQKLPSPPEIIVMDDAFQHRYVKPGLNILLTDYSKLYINDFVVPSGNLRESRSGAKRADIIVITKSPAVLSPLEIRRITSSLNPLPYQKVFFSYISYRKLKPLNEAALELDLSKKDLQKWGVLMMTAIANPQPLFLYLMRYSKEVLKINFRDHHFFNEKDYEKVKQKLDELLSPKKLIITTEKDAVKLDLEKLGDTPIFCIPITTKFHKQGEESFTEEIDKYVRSYTGK